MVEIISKTGAAPLFLKEMATGSASLMCVTVSEFTVISYIKYSVCEEKVYNICTTTV